MNSLYIIYPELLTFLGKVYLIPATLTNIVISLGRFNINDGLIKDPLKIENVRGCEFCNDKLKKE